MNRGWSWIIMDYHGLSWIIVDYRGFSYIIDHMNLVLARSATWWKSSSAWKTRICDCKWECHATQCFTCRGRVGRSVEDFYPTGDQCWSTLRKCAIYKWMIIKAKGRPRLVSGNLLSGLQDGIRPYTIPLHVAGIQKSIRQSTAMGHPLIQSFQSVESSYCRWTKSCTGWQVVYHKIILFTAVHSD